MPRRGLATVLLACASAAADASCYLSHTLEPGAAGSDGGFSSGARFACAVRSGHVACWGDDGLGAAEDRCEPPPAGEHGDCAPRPVEVLGTAGATTVVVGTAHACALLATGRVLCWGSNLYGNLGDGSTRDSAAPVRVAGIDDATALAAGAYYTCALHATGRISCWGQNVAGVLGDGHGVHGSLCYPLSFDCAPLPVSVMSDEHFVTVRAGYTHACGITADGTLYCWGGNVAGEVGDGSTGAHYQPVRVSTGVVSVATGSDFTCAALVDGSVSCWGAVPLTIPLVDETSACFPGRCTTRPVRVPDPSRTCDDLGHCREASTDFAHVRAVSAGSGHVCALHDDGHLSCLGALPAARFPRDVVDVETGSTSLDTCFRVASGDLYCWPHLRGTGDWTSATGTAPVTPVAFP